MANVPYQEYQLDLLFIKHLPDQNYVMAMLCTDPFTKYCAIVPIKSKNKSELALGFIECMNNMGKPTKVVYTDGETGIIHIGIFQKYVSAKHYMLPLTLILCSPGPDINILNNVGQTR